MMWRCSGMRTAYRSASRDLGSGSDLGIRRRPTSVTVRFPGAGRSTITGRDAAVDGSTIGAGVHDLHRREGRSSRFGFRFECLFPSEEDARRNPIATRDLGNGHAGLRRLIDDPPLLHLAEAAAPRRAVVTPGTGSPAPLVI